MSFAHWTFEELRKDYADACAWLARLGVKVGGSRFASTAAYVDLMVDSWRAQDASLFQRDPELRTGIYSLIEARELVEIHHTFQGAESPGLRKRLKDASKGPDAGVNESGNDGSGRDFLAEVYWAALLRRAGARVHLPSDSNAPDVVQDRVLRPKRPGGLVWEVKRPRGPGSVRGAIEKAAEQIGRAKRGEKPAGVPVLAGVPVIFVDYAIPDWPVIFGSNQESVRQQAADFLRNWAVDRKAEAKFYAPDASIAGIIYVWRPLGVCPLPGGERSAVQQVIQVQRDADVGAAARRARRVVGRIITKMRPPP